MPKTCIIIVGPTAVGKTSFAIKLAQHFNTEIISADSRQCFKELNIGVAKPSISELSLVPHHFINSHSINDEMNAGVFEQYALNKIKDIFNKHDIAIMVGGTGLYIKSFCDGIDELPKIDATIKNNIRANYEKFGLEWLQNEVKKNDIIYFKCGEIKNPQRLMRALEVKLSTGKSILDFQTKEKKVRDFNIIKIGLQLPRQILYSQINERVDVMMQQGFVNEVKQLQQFQKLNALQTVGYKELFSLLNKKISEETAVEQIKLNTRHYAKRQMTWFKKDEEIKWVLPEDTILNLLAKTL